MGSARGVASRAWLFSDEVHLNDALEPYHAHIYYTLPERAAIEALHQRLQRMIAGGELLFVGDLRDHGVGPHPLPQFEIHFEKQHLFTLMPALRASGFRALVHPLTDDDLADHTTLATWIGEPLELDVTTLDPPGMNQGVARFGKSDF